MISSKMVKSKKIIGVVNSMARVIMISSKVPKKLWEYAIRHAAFVLRVLPTSSNEDFRAMERYGLDSSR